jgi:midasin
LCSHLRILLEPIVATKLRGDYKTGKRINIKKVIAYIASNYRKDKLWLRRTKPTTRRYQIMIAIDDSESMKTNGAARPALEALSVLTHAMVQLEVGELAVCRFGDDFRLLHPFQTPFTDSSGEFVVSQFSFRQRRTNWSLFLKNTIRLLSEVRSSQNGSNTNGISIQTLQLVFIISDALILQDRETVAKLAREALQRQQLLVLIILDTQKNDQSIENLQCVSYDKNKVVKSSYLENFPFPFHIVIRQLASLPDIVAEAMRQWFELISQSSND